MTYNDLLCVSRNSLLPPPQGRWACRLEGKFSGCDAIPVRHDCWGRAGAPVEE